MIKFNEVKEKHIETLGRYVPIVERVHGEAHPEFYNVRKLFDEINTKLKDAGQERPELEKEFEDLRQVTSNYTIPEGVCESYEAVYNMLAELDKAYQG